MKLTLKTITQKILYVEEITGQISDGHWENSGPRDHYQDWCRCEVAVGDNAGRDFHTRKTNYNLLSKDLLEVIGQRMIHFGRLAAVLGDDEALLRGVIDGLDLDGNVAPLDHDWSSACGWPQEVRDQVAATIREESLYSRKDLMRDLREIRAAMKTGPN